MGKILVVVDMQNDFISGSLGSERGKEIVSRVAEKIKQYQQGEYPVIFTRDTHKPNYLETLEGKNLPVTHCIENTDGWQIESSLQALIRDNDIIIDKPTFGSITLGEVIADFAGQDKELEVELIGLCTDICVVSNALLIKANIPEHNVIVDSNCCGGVTKESHEAALTTMKMCQIQVI